jgi:L-ascorbate metabolism protein UlaG (beta-lactamase superfamily)
MGGTYTMDVDEAIRAANSIKAKITVPMHYKRLLGDKAKDAEKKFKDGVQGEVVIMKEIA